MVNSSDALDQRLNRLSWEVELLCRKVDRYDERFDQFKEELREELKERKEEFEKDFATKADLNRLREILFELRKVVYAVIAMICVGVLGAILKLVLK